MPRASKEELDALMVVLDQRKRERVLAYAAYWRAASLLPSYRPYCDAWFRLAQAGGEFYLSDRSDYTPEGREVDMGAGYAFLMQAHELPEYKAYWKAYDRECAASRAFFKATGIHDAIKRAVKRTKKAKRKTAR